jgi:hypothetical protein
MYIAKLKDGPKRVKKISQWFGKGFQNGMMEGDKMESYKKNFWSWIVFLLSKYWPPLLFEETLGAFFLFFFLFSILFLPLFISFYYASSLEDLGVLMIFEEKNHFFNNFFSNEMVWSG